MIKLKTLLPEVDGDVSSDEFEDWKEYLYYVENDIDASEIRKLIKRFNLKGKSFFDGKIACIYGEPEAIYLEFDLKNQTADLIKDITDWVYSLTDSGFSHLGIDEDNIYNAYVESSLADLAITPGKVYHYTTEEKWEEIQADGKMIGSSGTGLSNRYTHGIFTSTNQEEYQDGTYGDICLELDLTTFKAENKLEKLMVSFEPDVVDWLKRDYVISKLELEIHNELESGSGMSPYTVIVHHEIPIKYIRQI